MILANLQDAVRYYSLHPRMQELFEYIKSTDFSKLSAGRITLYDDALFINLDVSSLLDKEQQKLEFHKKYIDVQIPLLVNETMGWSPINKLGKPDIPYDEARDCGLYFKPAQTYFTVSPNEFTIFFPEDAHAPIIGEGTQRKLIGKLLI